MAQSLLIVIFYLLVLCAAQPFWYASQRSKKRVSLAARKTELMSQASLPAPSSRRPSGLSLVFILCASTAMSAQALSAQHRSPYFIDGIQCEGLELESGAAARLTRGYGITYADEVEAMAERARTQERCEAIFEDARISKFQWVSPSDLENMAMILKQAKRFQAAEIRIEKSELQNHVYIIGRFTPYKLENVYHFDVKGGLEHDPEGDRRSIHVSGQVELDKAGPNNAANLVVGFQHYNTDADHALPASALRYENKNVDMSPTEAAAQARPSGDFSTIYLQSRQGEHLSISGNLNSTHISGDERATLDYGFGVNSSFRINPIIPAMTTFSLFYSTYSATGSQIYDRKVLDGTSRSVTFAGLKQEINAKYIDGYFDFYRSLTSDLHYFGDISLLFKLGSVADTGVGLGAESHYVRGAVLPQHRFGLPDRSTDAIYVQLDHSLPIASMDTNIALRLGGTRYMSLEHPANPYYRSAFYSELSLNSRKDDLDLGLAFIYGNRRLY